VAEYLGFDQLYIWDGKESRQLTAASKHHREPVWGEDGKIYLTFGDKGYYQTAVVDPCVYAQEGGKAEVISPFRETLLESFPLPGGEILSTVYEKRAYKIYRWRPPGNGEEGVTAE
jgi:hypothetical protein